MGEVEAFMEDIAAVMEVLVEANMVGPAGRVVESLMKVLVEVRMKAIMEARM